MKNKNIFIFIGLIFILVLSIGVMYPKQSEKDELKNNTSNLISIMLENDIASDEYEKTEVTKWPIKGYSFNEEESYCDNDSIIKWINNKIQVIGNISDKCYIFFNKIVKDYDYTGTSQEFIVPVTGTYKIELWGAQGSSYDEDHQGGKGAYVSGIIELNENDNLYIYVGGHPDNQSEEAGYNGGGVGSHHTQNGYAGGGATDIRLENGDWNLDSSLNSRIMVAAGGGGCGFQAGENHIGLGGAAGGLIGYDGIDKSQYAYHNHHGTGANQVVGGFNSDYSYPNSKKNIGGFGYGGYDDYGVCGGSAGGGGYYGGGAANRGHAGGGGGSSFISGHTGCLAITSATDRNPKSGCNEDSKTIECATHYSNYKFENTEMIDGLGYKWITEAGEQTGMPSPSGETEMGHVGNGYARITYLGK